MSSIENRIRGIVHALTVILLGVFALYPRIEPRFLPINPKAPGKARP
jgi:hypothetical protein